MRILPAFTAVLGLLLLAPAALAADGERPQAERRVGDEYAAGVAAEPFLEPRGQLARARAAAAPRSAHAEALSLGRWPTCLPA